MGGVCGLVRSCCGNEEHDYDAEAPSNRRSLIDRRGSASSKSPSRKRGSFSSSTSPGRKHSSSSPERRRRSSFDALSAVLWRGSSPQRTLRIKPTKNVTGWAGQWTVPMSLFGGASDDCCRAVAEHLRPRALTDGEVLFREGDEGTSMFFVNSGAVGVMLQDREIATLEVPSRGAQSTWTQCKRRPAARPAAPRLKTINIK